jgi:hypothetical protein
MLIVWFSLRFSCKRQDNIISERTSQRSRDKMLVTLDVVLKQTSTRNQAGVWDPNAADYVRLKGTQIQIHLGLVSPDHPPTSKDKRETDWLDFYLQQT